MVAESNVAVSISSAPTTAVPEASVVQNNVKSEDIPEGKSFGAPGDKVVQVESGLIVTPWDCFSRSKDASNITITRNKNYNKCGHN